MKLTIPRATMVAALTTVRSVAKGSTLPILSNVLLKADDGHVELTCSDLDITIRTETLATISEEGECTVNANLLFGIVNAFTGEDVDLEVVKDGIKILSGSSKYKLGTLDVDEFPPAAKFEAAVEFELPQLALRSVLAETAFASGTDESRYILCSSFLSLNGKLTSCATDGRRLAVEEADLVNPQKSKANLIIPTKAVKELLRLLEPRRSEAKAGATEEKDDEKLPPVQIAVVDTAAKFQFGSVTFTTKVLEGTYPNYEQVIPESNDDAIAVGRTDFLAALKRVNLIADGACTLEFKGQTLTVKAKGTKTGLSEGSESLLIPRVKPMTVKFNPDFLIEALGAVTDDEVLIQVADKTAPCLFRVASKPWRAVTMCLRPDEDPKAAEAPAAS